jgi:hypothetical protein
MIAVSFDHNREWKELTVVFWPFFSSIFYHFRRGSLPNRLLDSKNGYPALKAGVGV